MVGQLENLFHGVARTLKKYTHQRETSVSSNDSLLLRPFSNDNFS